MSGAERTSGSRATRQAARQASTKFESQLNSSPTRSDPPPSPAKPVRRAPSRPNLKQKSVKSASGIPASASATQRPRSASGRKRPVSLDSRASDGRDSSLTSLSNPPSPINAARTLRNSAFRSISPGGDPQFGWILVNHDGDVFAPRDESGMWWPCRELNRTPFRVLLFERIGERAEDRVIELPAPPSEDYYVEFDSDRAIRFCEPKDAAYPKPSSDESPKKRQKMNLEAQWQLAVSRAVHEVQSNHFPSVQFMQSTRDIPGYQSGSQDRASISQREKPTTTRPQSIRSEKAAYVPPPPDETLDIPGELVYARETAASNKYWPAQILKYEPPSKPSAPPRYHVQWVDASRSSITRDLFYTFDEPGFGTCFLGTFASEVTDAVNDADAEDEGEEDSWTRESSPQPLDPPPDGPTFSALDLRQQFVHTKPVLQAILRDEYAPAREAHLHFLAGGNTRLALAKKASIRGLLDPRQVEKLGKLIVEWCVRPERNSRHVDQQVREERDSESASVPHSAPSPTPTEDVGQPSSPVLDPPTSSFTIAGDEDEAMPERPMAQTGCEGFESLTEVDKLSYCLDVLLPQALVQIILWRNGRRQSLALLSAQEEQQLYNEGREELDTSDWVLTVKHLRQVKEKKLLKDSEKKSKGQVVKTGKVLRQRR
ncbi:unnamed protein product [Mycena citricolor]|uniref:PWWP domain-containing protein n=1 Tax=Mycena citricolor TaxID=2018698 RepID=A0AAD2HKF0_9AGAR|nr:unnamed protein product [Mycena citricolor]